MTIDTRIAALLPTLTVWRHDLHAHPELMYDVPRTAGFVAGTLRDAGFDAVTEGVGRSGVVGLIKGNRPGPQRMFRADMDALPILETSGSAHASTIKGRMHACGHDGHTVMLLGAAVVLAETRDFAGTLVFVFQPAEEGGAGAQAMIDDGLLDRWPVSQAYALHNWPGLPVGEFAIRPGPIMASADGFVITVHGRGGHAAEPQKARDPIPAAAQFITACQTIVSRLCDPQDPAVVSITSIQGGEAFNVIPDCVTMRCGFRAYSEKTAQLIETELRRLASGIGAATDTEITLTRTPMTPYPPTVNHSTEATTLRAAMEKLGAVQTDLNPVMGSEDFAFILRRVPGAYGFIGNGDTAPLHNPAYDFADEAIPFGVGVWCALASEV